MIYDNFNYSAVDVVLSNQTNHQREMVNGFRDVPDGHDGRDGISSPPGPAGPHGPVQEQHYVGWIRVSLYARNRCVV